MRPIRFLFRRISVREEGFTLLEMVITMTILVVVLATIMGVFGVVQRQTAFVENRSETLDTMRIAVDRMTKEIRQAKIVDPTSTASHLEMTTYVLGVQQDIVYTVTGDSITRSVAGGTPKVLQNDLSDTNIFSYTSDAGGVIQVVALTLSVHPPRRPETTLVLTSEVRLRNRSDVV